MVHRVYRGELYAGKNKEVFFVSYGEKCSGGGFVCGGICRVQNFPPGVKTHKARMDKQYGYKKNRLAFVQRFKAGVAVNRRKPFPQEKE